jgi:penicillin-binding protein 2
VTYTEYVFAENVDITFISKVKERGLDGVQIQSVATRQYNTTYAAHVLGRVGLISTEEWPTYKEQGYPMDAYVGKEGVELAFESYLHGTSGTRQIATSDSGKIISQAWVEEPEPGANVTLTLDIGLQAVVENSIAAHVASLTESGGAACAVVDMTGGVLALASYPTYDLSTYGENFAELSQDSLQPYLNRATSELYAPGSTFKLLTATAGLMEGIITPKDTTYCSGSYTYSGWKDTLRYCHKRSGHGTENLVKAIKDSCNVYFYDLGRRVGITKLNEYAAQFGLGESTGIEIGDLAGFVAGPETSEYYGQQWQVGNILSAAIGQENNMFTPLQLANYIATLVNGGNNYACHLLKSVKSNDYSQVLYEYEPELRNSIDIPDAYLSAMKEGMYQVTQNSAIARYFNNLPVKAGAKTGTAELTTGSDTKETNGLLVVFAPYEDPQIALCIVMEKGASGSSLASIAYDILDYYFSSEDSLSTVSSENTLIR